MAATEGVGASIPSPSALKNPYLRLLAQLGWVMVGLGLVACVIGLIIGTTSSYTAYADLGYDEYVASAAYPGAIDISSWVFAILPTGIVLMGGGFLALLLFLHAKAVAWRPRRADGDRLT